MSKPDSLSAFRPSYTYRVVTANGAGLHGPAYTKCSDAKKAAQRCAENDSRYGVKLGPFEIERVLTSASGGRRYWMRKRSRWVPWKPSEDVDVREPDWIYGV